MYVSATAPVLHPSAQDVSSVADATPVRQWAGAIEQGRQVVRATLAEQNWPGLSVAVGTGGDIVWAEGFGWANLENKVPVSPETQFRIGTMSTVLTSAAVGLLLEKDRLKLDEKIQTYVPEFQEQQWPVTLRQVMGHVAGVRNDSGDEGLQTSLRLPSGQETGYGLGWDLETVTLAGERARWVGHDGMLLSGMVGSLMTFPARGLVVALITNTSYADTESLALRIAHAFAEK